MAMSNGNRCCHLVVSLVLILESLPYIFKRDFLGERIGEDSHVIALHCIALHCIEQVDLYIN